MRYQTFGRLTGLRVSEYALGTANFSASGAETWREIFDAFVAAGGTTFDTSNLYQDGEAETVLGGLLGRRRDDFVVITKYSGTRQRDPRCPRLQATGMALSIFPLRHADDHRKAAPASLPARSRTSHQEVGNPADLVEIPSLGKVGGDGVHVRWWSRPRAWCKAKIE